MPPFVDKLIQAARNLTIGRRERSKKTPEDNEKLSKKEKITECPVCLKKLTPPVKLCKNEDAAVCEKCAESLDRCPTCKEEFFPKENTFVNNILEAIPVVCKNNENGCCQVMIKEKMVEHEEVCDYRFIECNMKGCKSSDVIYYCKMYRHVRLKHSNNSASFSFGTFITLNFKNWTSPSSFIYTNLKEKDSGKFFAVKRLTTEDKMFYVWVQYISSNENARKYLYEVSFDQGQSIMFTSGRYCPPYIFTREELKKEPNVLSLDIDKGFHGGKPVSNLKVNLKIIKNEFFGKDE